MCACTVALRPALATAVLARPLAVLFEYLVRTDTRIFTFIFILTGTGMCLYTASYEYRSRSIDLSTSPQAGWHISKALLIRVCHPKDFAHKAPLTAPMRCSSQPGRQPASKQPSQQQEPSQQPYHKQLANVLCTSKYLFHACIVAAIMHHARVHCPPQH